MRPPRSFFQSARFPRVFQDIDAELQVAALPVCVMSLDIEPIDEAAVACYIALGKRVISPYTSSSDQVSADQKAEAQADLAAFDYNKSRRLVEIAELEKKFLDN